MANMIIRYDLIARATPSFIDDGGYYPKPNDNEPPADFDLIGATIEGATETALGVLDSQEAVKDYLDTYTQGWTQPSATDPNIEVPFSQSQAAAYIWSLKT
jgi:hypothetical protein